MYVNGSKKELEVAAQSYHGRTYLPLRAIGEALGKSVSYESNYKLIIITGSPEWVKRDSFFDRFYIIASYAIDSNSTF